MLNRKYFKKLAACLSMVMAFTALPGTFIQAAQVTEEDVLGELDVLTIKDNDPLFKVSCCWVDRTGKTSMVITVNGTDKAAEKRLTYPDILVLDPNRKVYDFGRATYKGKTYDLLEYNTANTADKEQFSRNGDDFTIKLSSYALDKSVSAPQTGAELLVFVEGHNKDYTSTVHSNPITIRVPEVGKKEFFSVNDGKPDEDKDKDKDEDKDKDKDEDKDKDKDKDKVTVSDDSSSVSQGLVGPMVDKGIKTTVKDEKGNLLVSKVLAPEWITYNGTTHKTQYDKTGKKVTNDITVEIQGSVSGLATPKVKVKNSRKVSGNKGDKKRCYVNLSFKANKGATKEQKDLVKLLNKELKNQNIYVDMRQADLSKAKFEYKTDKKNTKITKLTANINGYTFKLSKKEYTFKPVTSGGYELNFSGNFKGTAQVK